MPKRGTIGIDIGGTKMLFALFDDKFAVLEEIKIKTQAEKGEKVFTDNLTAAVESLLRAAKKRDLVLVGVGLGIAGSIDADKGTMKACLNIPFLKGYSFRTKLTKMTGANVYIANDVQAGLYGEHQFGAAVGKKHVVGVFLGTGIGGALIIDSKLHVGATGCAGDIGHYLVHPIGSLAGSERLGVLDDVASRTAIAAEAATFAAKQWAPHLLKDAGTDVKTIKSGDLADAVQKGDKAIEELIRSRARLVGIALSNIVDFFNPDMVVLGGGLVEAMPSLFRQEIEKGIREHTTEEAQEGLKVAVAKLKGHAVTTGAAKLALDTFLSSQQLADPTTAKR